MGNRLLTQKNPCLDCEQSINGEASCFAESACVARIKFNITALTREQTAREIQKIIDDIFADAISIEEFYACVYDKIQSRYLNKPEEKK